MRSIQRFLELLRAILALMLVATNASAQLSPPAILASPGATPPQPSTVINPTNASAYSHFLPPGADLATKYGLVMRVVPTKRLDWSTGFTTATEKYSGQVGLDADNSITNYIAGMHSIATDECPNSVVVHAPADKSRAMPES
jgi:hypothetical protein